MTRTKCIDPRQIEEGDLIAYLHGDTDSHVVEHIAHCSYCAEQVEQLRMVDVQLLAAFYRDACPTAEVLADFVLNRLPAVEKLRVAAHVRGCAACSGEVEAVRDLTDEEPSSLLVRLREMLALALVAQPIAPVAMPARGQGWQGRFEADDLIVTLSAQAGNLTGRVRRRGAPPSADHSGQVWLVGKEATAEEDIPSSKIDRRGRFRLMVPAAGLHTLLLQIGEQNVALEAIQVE
jgi:anti-sigma factor RsiW